MDDVTNGQKGIADFVYDNFLTDDKQMPMYVCTDSSRKIFAYKTEDGKFAKDIGASLLIEKVHPSICKQTAYLGKQKMDEIDNKDRASGEKKDYIIDVVQRVRQIKNPEKNRDYIDRLKTRSLDPSVIPKEPKLLYDEEINKIEPASEDSNDDDDDEEEYIDLPPKENCRNEYFIDVVNLMSL